MARVASSVHAAGGGAAAVAYLHEATKARSDADGPKPPTGPPSGRPRPAPVRRTARFADDGKEEEEERPDSCTAGEGDASERASWLRILLPLSPEADADLSGCVGAALQAQHAVEEFLAECRAIGLPEVDAKAKLLAELFPDSAAKAHLPNPQDAVKSQVEEAVPCGDAVSTVCTLASPILEDKHACSNSAQATKSQCEDPMMGTRRSILRLPTSALPDIVYVQNNNAAGDTAPAGEETQASNGRLIITSKWAYLQDHAAKHQGKHPLYDALVTLGGDVEEAKKVLETEKLDLQASLDGSHGLPNAIFFAIATLRSLGVLNLLVSHGADIGCKWLGPHEWDGILPGYTPLEAVRKLGAEPGASSDNRFDAMEYVLSSRLQQIEAQKSKSADENSLPRCVRHSLTWTGSCTQQAIEEATEALDLGRSCTSPALKQMEGAVSWFAGQLARGTQKFTQSLDLSASKQTTSRRHSSLLARQSTALVRKSAVVRKSVDALVEPPTERGSLKRRHTVAPGTSTSSSQSSAMFICAHVMGSPKQVYDLEDQVGSGTFGCVRKAKHHQTGQTHAVKTCPKALLSEAEVMQEIEIMRQLDHPHILRMYNTFEDDSNIYLASEICEGGQLFDAIVNAGALTEKTAARIFKQMLSAVAYLHFKSICHRDLKPENFLLASKAALSDAKVKLIDFGTAKRYDLSELSTKVCTVHYVAPEVLKRSNSAYTEKVDMWSCGVILYVMLCGCPPFHHDDDLELLKLVKKGKYQFKPKSIWDSVSEDAKTLIQSMLNVKVQDRVSASQAAHHRWLQSASGSDAEHELSEQIMRRMKSFTEHNRLKKAALQVVARNISDDSIEELRTIFLELDEDNSGMLSMDEIEQALSKFNVTGNVRAEMRMIMGEMAEDSDSNISYSKFIAATIQKQHYLKEEVCKAAFHLFDADDDGYISKKDLVILLANGNEDFGVGVSEDEVNDIMNEVDRSGDGEISFEEFMEMMGDKTSTMTSTPLGASLRTSTKCFSGMSVAARSGRQFIEVLDLGCVEEDSTSRRTSKAEDIDILQEPKPQGRN